MVLNIFPTNLGSFPAELWHEILSSLSLPISTSTEIDYASVKSHRKDIITIAKSSKLLNGISRQYLYEDLVLLNQDQALRFFKDVGIDRSRLTKKLKILYHSQKEHQTNIFVSVQISTKIAALFSNLVSLHIEDCLRAPGMLTRLSIDFLPSLDNLEHLCLLDLSLVWKEHREEVAAADISKEFDSLVSGSPHFNSLSDSKTNSGYEYATLQNYKKRPLKTVNLSKSHLNFPSAYLVGLLEAESLSGLEELDLSGCRGLDESVLEVLRRCFVGVGGEDEGLIEDNRDEEAEKGQVREFMRLKKLDLSDTYLVGLEGLGDVWEDEEQIPDAFGGLAEN